jgi:hypothetical protein
VVTRLPLLGDVACDSVVAEVLAQRARWKRRGTAEFYTLGAASYLDGGDGYEARTAELNPILLARFAPLYAHLRERLAEALGAPVVLADGKAVPGFHVWGVPGIPTGPHASLHFDLQYEKLLWPDGDASAGAASISFTLPLLLPRRGAGLSLWDTTYERVQAFFARTAFPGTLDDLLPLFAEHVEPYARGELLVHSGHQLHRIAPIPEVEPDDLRITLQGHGRKSGGVWHIYW